MNAKLNADVTRFLRFGAVGVAGFLADAGVLLLAVQLAHVAPFPGRIISFVTAATMTFVLNSRFTFGLAERLSAKRWIVYLLTTALGAFINVGIYHWWLQSHGTTPSQLVIGTAIGSIVAMFINFFLSKSVVFRQSTNLVQHFDLDVGTIKR